MTGLDMPGSPSKPCPVHVSRCMESTYSTDGRCLSNFPTPLHTSQALTSHGWWWWLDDGSALRPRREEKERRGGETTPKWERQSVVCNLQSSKFNLQSGPSRQVTVPEFKAIFLSHSRRIQYIPCLIDIESLANRSFTVF